MAQKDTPEMYRRLLAVAQDEAHRDNLRAVVMILRLAGVPMSEESSSPSSPGAPPQTPTPAQAAQLLAIVRSPSPPSGEQES